VRDPGGVSGRDRLGGSWVGADPIPTPGLFLRETRAVARRDVDGRPIVVSVHVDVEAIGRRATHNERLCTRYGSESRYFYASMSYFDLRRHALTRPARPHAFRERKSLDRGGSTRIQQR
jgi:hypothetical protein